MGKAQGKNLGTHSAVNANANSGTPTANSTTSLQLDGDIENVAIQVVGATFSAISVQGTVDGSNWVTLGGTQIVNLATGTGGATIPANTPGIYRVNVAGLLAVRATSLAASPGSPAVTILGT
jgi:hypothetical protein